MKISGALTNGLLSAFAATLLALGGTTVEASLECELFGCEEESGDTSDGSDEESSDEETVDEPSDESEGLSLPSAASAQGVASSENGIATANAAHAQNGGAVQSRSGK